MFSAGTLEQVLSNSDDFYALPPITDFNLSGDQLTWTSAVHTASAENNIARARFFPAKSRNGKRPRRAVVVLPQWNAQPDSHVEACRIFNFLGISALRLTAPVSPGAAAARTRTRRSSGWSERRTHDPVFSPGRAGHARGSEVAKR